MDVTGPAKGGRESKECHMAEFTEEQLDEILDEASAAAAKATVREGGEWDGGKVLAEVWVERDSGKFTIHHEVVDACWCGRKNSYSTKGTGFTQCGGCGQVFPASAEVIEVHDAEDEAELLAAVARVVEEVSAECEQKSDALERELYAEVHQLALDTVSEAETITEAFVTNFIAGWSDSWPWDSGTYSAITESELADLISAVDSELAADADLKSAVAARIAELSGAK